jgi:hypothetical protein
MVRQGDDLYVRSVALAATNQVGVLPARAQGQRSRTLTSGVGELDADGVRKPRSSESTGAFAALGQVWSPTAGAGPC